MCVNIRKFLSIEYKTIIKHCISILFSTFYIISAQCGCGTGIRGRHKRGATT